MKKDKEKELDQLFKRGLEQPTWNANFREDDWDAMEALLDKDKKRAGIIYWLPLLGSVAAVLLLTLGWFLMRPDSAPAVVNHPAKQPVYNEQNRAIAGSTASQQQVALVKPNVIDTIPNRSATNSVNNAGQKSAVQVLADHKTTTRYAALNFKNSRKANNGLTHTSGVDINNTAASRTNFAVNGTNMLMASNTGLNLPGLDLNTKANVVLPALNKPQILPAYTKEAKTIKKLNLNRPQFAITVLASPDINGVNSFQNAKIGENVGLLFSVGLGKKFTVSTGAMYSKKPYLTNFADYHTTYKFKTDPDNVTADCRVLDIPININYQVYNKSNNRFSIGSGLSSYIMLSENYHYNYSSPYAYGPTDYDVVNKNRHFLGVLNLDANYSRKLNSKFSLNVEPYLKIPLTDIGYSQVKLQSTGLAVGITWNINSPPK